MGSGVRLWRPKKRLSEKTIKKSDPVDVPNSVPYDSGNISEVKTLEEH